MVVGSEIPRWLEPKGSRVMINGITFTPAGVEYAEAEGAT